MTGCIAIKRVDGFDQEQLARLKSWLSGRVPNFAGPVELEAIAGGQSNPTYRLRTPHVTYVLRGKPPGPLLKGAHAIEREARVMSALWAAGYPVPRVEVLCEDDSILGSSFYLMEMVEGRIFWDASFGNLPGAQREEHMDAMNATLAALHRIDPQTIGLADYGRGGNYMSRQVARWTQQYLHEEAAGRHPAMDRLVEWLPTCLPDQDRTTLVHGDFRADNMIFHPTEPRVIAVLDWELSTLGDPVADFAYHAMTYRMPREIQGGIAGLNAAAHGLPSESEYVAAYCRRTGRDSLPQLDYYMAFNMFRFSAILHGIRGRAIRGTAASSRGQAMGELFGRVADLAWCQAESAMRASARVA